MTHSYEKADLKKGATLISKLATLKDLENSLEGADPLNPSERKLEVYSNLILERELLEKSVEKGAIKKVLSTIKNMMSDP